MPKDANRRDYKFVKGADALRDALIQLSDGVRVKVLGPAVGAAIKPVLARAQIHADQSEDTGALKASLTTKVVTYPKRGYAVGMMGPAKNYFHAGKVISRVASAVGGFDVRRPARYAHLVEFGHHVAKAKEGAVKSKRQRFRVRPALSFVPAKPFIRPAVNETLPEQEAAFGTSVKRTFTRLARAAGRATKSTT